MPSHPILAAALLLLAAGLPASPQPRPAKGSRPMNQQAALDLITLPDGQYFTIGAERLLSLRGALNPTIQELDAGAVAPILAISAPRTVELQTLRRIPVLIATRATGLRNWRVDPEQNFTWLLTELTTGVTKSVSPQSLEKRRMATPIPSGSGQPPDEDNATASTYGIERVHLPALFGPTWPQGRYALTMVSYDRLSNTHIFETKPQPKQRPPLEFRPSPELRPAPAGGPQNALALDAPGSAVVRAGISIPQADAALGRSPDSPSQSVFPVTLVLVQLDSPVQTHFDLNVPATVAAGRVSASFAVNLRDLSAGQALKGAYLAYLCAGSSVTGPLALQLP